MIPTNKGPMTAERIVDELTYASYRFNRGTLEAEKLMRLFPETGRAMEQRYQRERGEAE